MGKIMAVNKTKSPDIQGLLFRSYLALKHTGYGLFTIGDRTKCQKWLEKLISSGEISTAEDGNPETIKDQETQKRSLVNKDDIRLNILFSASGMQKLLGKGWIPETYEPTFIEGMVNEHRSRVLGDIEENDPKHWRWGSNQDFDGILIAFASTKLATDKLLTKHLCTKNGTKKSYSFHGCFEGKAEPFGFIDGISQPCLRGSERHVRLLKNYPKEAELQAIEEGELLLGYPDGSGSLPRSPATSSACDCCDNLPVHWEWPERRDIGKNGTYVVIRQLAQNVDSFNKYLKTVAAKGDESAEELAEKMVGRRKNGDAFEPTERTDPRDNNSFDFTDDPQGAYCPVGSHIRRSNPRATGAPDPKAALSVSLRHRIIRRGRGYKDDKNNEVGLNFLCLNASISRQFEFVQASWCNNPTFHGLEKEVDPLIGTVIPKSGPIGAINRYTIPKNPYRRVLEDLPTFVTVKGGGYFFMPSMSALSCLSKAD